MFRKTFFIGAAITAVAGGSSAAVIDFSDQPLAPNTFNNGGPSTNTNGFHSGGAFFNSSYNSSYNSFTGTALSTVVNTGGDYPTVPDFGGNHEYASIAGGGVGGPLDTYGIAYAYPGDHTFFDLPAGQHPTSIDLTNTTYDYLAIKNGDGFARAFTNADFFDVTLTGYSGLDESGAPTGSVEFFLAQNGSIVTQWTALSLLGLGNAASIGVSFDSSDTGAFGINTPTFAAFDNLSTSPEPASGVMILGGLAIAACRRRRKD